MRATKEHFDCRYILSRRPNHAEQKSLQLFHLCESQLDAVHDPEYNPLNYHHLVSKKLEVDGFWEHR
jgi:hypothetical protein